MKKQELREAIALREKKLHKIEKHTAEKPTLERELSKLRAELSAIEEEQDKFFDAIEKTGYTVKEAGAKLGIDFSEKS